MIKGVNWGLIITDGGKGLHSALEYVYPKILKQRCWAHKTRNILDKVRKKDWELVKKTLHRISYAKNRREATKAYWATSPCPPPRGGQGGGLWGAVFLWWGHAVSRYMIEGCSIFFIQ